MPNKKQIGFHPPHFPPPLVCPKAGTLRLFGAAGSESVRCRPRRSTQGMAAQLPGRHLAVKRLPRLRLRPLLGVLLSWFVTWFVT